VPEDTAAAEYGDPRALHAGKYSYLVEKEAVYASEAFNAESLDMGGGACR
jgi:hypothetical protein